MQRTRCGKVCAWIFDSSQSSLVTRWLLLVVPVHECNAANSTSHGRSSGFCLCGSSLVISTESGLAAWESLQSCGRVSPLQLATDLVDCPEKAGTCDPLKLLPHKWTEVNTAASTMFPDPLLGLDHFSVFYSCERDEYVRLVLRQLRCGKTVLCSKVRGGGTIFQVG